MCTVRLKAYLETHEQGCEKVGAQHATVSPETAQPGSFEMCFLGRHFWLLWVSRHKY